MLNKIGIIKNISSSFTAVLRGHIKDICFSVCMKNQIGKNVYLRSSITNFSTQSCYRIMTLPRDTRNMSCNSMKGLVLGVYTESSDECSKIVSYTPSFKDVDKQFNGQLSELLKVTGPFYKPIKQRLIWTPLYFQELKEKLISKECIVLADFAENYTFTIQDEIRSYHWNNNQQATIN